MWKKALSCSLVSFMTMTTGINSAVAYDSHKQQAQSIEKVKSSVSKLGTGKHVQVEVKLRNKRKVNGYIKEAGPEDFLLADSTNGTTRTIAYTDVKKLEGYNLSTGEKVVVGVGVTAGILFVIWLLFLTSD